MRYEDIRQLVHEHFRKRLTAFKEKIASDGPIEGVNLEAAMKNMDLANLEFGEWLDLLHTGDGTTLVNEFREKHGIKTELPANAQRRLLQEFHRANQAYLAKALEYNSSYDELDIDDAATSLLQAQSCPTVGEVEPFKDVVQRHLDEGERTGTWTAKTLTEKRDALNLLGDLTMHKAVGALTKADARLVKNALQRLPKNRNKSPRTRDLSLSAMLELTDVPLASVRTLNGYMSAFQTFLRWAVEQGYAETNIFDGMRFKVPRHERSDMRDPFSIDQLNLLFEHLSENPSGLVKKDAQKWVTLIAMFTGARLNEVAQLGVSDVREVGNVWCFDLTTDNDEDKRLKTTSSKRLVPIHDALLDLGLLKFVENQAATGCIRLFPDLTYSAQNGYGRNVGRWFNESFLVSLNLKKPTLVFHSLRHSMNTQLAQKDVPDQLQKAVLGHAQSGMSYDTYFKDGFLPTQLRPVVNKFSLGRLSKEIDSPAQ